MKCHPVRRCYLVISPSMLSRCDEPMRLFNFVELWFEWLARRESPPLNGSVRLNEFVRLWLGERNEHILLLRFRLLNSNDCDKPSSPLMFCNILLRKSIAPGVRLLLWELSLGSLWCLYGCEWDEWVCEHNPSPCRMYAILKAKNKKKL